MPRAGYYWGGERGGAGAPDLTSDLLTSIAQIPNLPQTFLAILENLSYKSSGSLKPVDVANSDLVPHLIEILRDDYTSLVGDHLGGSQRSSKLRLLNAACSLLLPDIKSKEIASLLALLCQLLQEAAGSERRLKGEEQLSVLQLLTTFVNRCASAIGDRLGEILGFLSVLSGLHRSSEGLSLIPTNLPHLHFSQASQDRSKKDSSCSGTSGSEFSDQEIVGNGDLRRRRDEVLIEKEALNAITVIVKKCQKKEVVSFWFIFLPDRSFCPLKGGVSEVLSHHVKKLRMVAINIMIEFLQHSNQFLALAQHQDKDSSYTSLSTALALSLLNLHKILLARLKDSLGNTEFVALLKLFSVLGENCSYSRLFPGLLSKIVNSLMELAERERNPVIQVAVLSVFVSLGHGVNVPELRDVSRIMFGFIHPRSLPVPQSQVADNNVRYMALQALSVLTQLDIQMFLKNAGEIKKLIDISLKDADPSIVLHTFRFIKCFTKYLTEAVLQNKDPESRLRTSTVSFWIDFLKQGNFQLLDQHTNANIRSAFSDCLAEIGPEIFTELPEPKRIVCITYVLGQCKNALEMTETNSDLILQDRAALSSCLRTLGIFVTFPIYLTDTAFHTDVADAVLPHLPIRNKDKKGPKPSPDPGAKTVRVSASWALANLSDILIASKSEMERTGEFDEFPSSWLGQMLETGISLATDSASAVNTKSNAVRCVGNMLNYISPDIISDEKYQNLMDSGTRALITNISSGKIMKIRWNACYASANVLKKAGLSESTGPWVRDLVLCLINTINNFQNFKVRINAALALGSVWGRPVLGTQFFSVLQGLVSSLESSQNLEVFGEWQHQANLVDQLCITICHLLSFLENQQEFTKCCRMLHENWDVTETSFTSAAKRMAPEKFAPVLRARTHLEQFSPRNDEESQVRSLLQSCVEGGAL